ncbi:MAG: hypothetical protein ACR2O1_12565 [Boseongicola sp.]
MTLESDLHQLGYPRLLPIGVAEGRVTDYDRSRPGHISRSHSDRAIVRSPLTSRGLDALAYVVQNVARHRWGSGLCLSAVANAGTVHPTATAANERAKIIFSSGDPLVARRPHIMRKQGRMYGDKVMF